MDYGAVSSLLARTTGAFYANLRSGSSLRGTGRTVALPTGTLDLIGRDWLNFRLKALDEKIPAALDLTLRIITESDFSDQRRIRDLVLEMKNDVDSSLAPAGHNYAMARSGHLFSRSRSVDEIWNGISQIETVHKIAAMDTSEICHALTRIRDTLISRAGLLVNITGNAGALKTVLDGISGRFGSFGAPRPRNGDCTDPALFSDPASVVPGLNTACADPAHTDSSRPAVEVLSSPSLQVGFAAMTLPGASLISREAGIEAVLSHWLSTGALWEDIRMKGGAYGAFALPDGVEETFSLSTYRDPNPLRSLESFPAILQRTGRAIPDEEALTKAVIGSFAAETRPRTSAEKGNADFLRFLYGINDRQREVKLQSLVSITREELAAAAKRLAAAMDAAMDGSANTTAGDPIRGIPVVIAGPAEAEKAAAKLGVAVRELPV
jgi:Zn-dependent M16 (insulinase) family peptidase